MVKDFQRSLVKELIQETNHYKGLIFHCFGDFKDGTLGITWNCVSK